MKLIQSPPCTINATNIFTNIIIFIFHWLISFQTIFYILSQVKHQADMEISEEEKKFSVTVRDKNPELQRSQIWGTYIYLMI